MGLINDILLGFTFLAYISNDDNHFAAGKGNHSIACFTGLRKTGLEELKEIQICPHEEVCYFKYYLDDQLNRVIDAGCRSKRDCKLGECAENFYKNQEAENETVFRTRKDLILCDECCYTGLCNKQGCSLALNLNQMPRRCFGECTHVEDMKSCLKWTQCESENYMCVLHHEISGEYTLKCERRAMCELLMTLPNPRDECCDSDLCNFIPHFENIFNGSDTNNVECPKNLIPTSKASIQSPTTITNINLPTTITKSRLPTTPQSNISITSIQSPTSITSTRPPTSITSNQTPTSTTKIQSPDLTSTWSTTTTMTTTDAVTIAPSTVITTKTSLSAMPTVASKRPPVTLPPVQRTCLTCGDSAPDTCEYQYEETQCDPPNNYCMNIITNSISGSRTVERKCVSFDDCYSNWWQGSSDEELCQTFTADRSLTANFQCSFCCIENKCNEDIKPPKATLYQDN